MHKFQTKENRDAYTIAHSKRVGDWVIAPYWHCRMNKRTLGLPTHRTGGSVFWHNWGIWFSPDAMPQEHESPFMEFSRNSQAVAYLNNRLKNK